jgi:hypothetical protein
MSHDQPEGVVMSRIPTRKTLRHVVKIDSHECTCIKWQHTGKPCHHALEFLIGTTNINFHPFVHEYYSVLCSGLPTLERLNPSQTSQQLQVTLDFKMVPAISKRSVG